MAVSDARRLKLSEQARANWGEETAEVLMIALTPLYLGMIAMAIGIAGLYFTG